MVTRSLAVLWVAALLAGVGCSSGGGTDAPDLGFATTMPQGEALELAGVWTIDVAETLAVASRDASVSPDDTKGLAAMLEHTNTQLALYRDGAFVLKNLRPDAGGTVTVEGSWTYEESVLRLRGHRLNGALREPPKDVSYRRETGRLIRVSEAEPGAVMPILRRSLEW